MLDLVNVPERAGFIVRVVLVEEVAHALGCATVVICSSRAVQVIALRIVEQEVVGPQASQDTIRRVLPRAHVGLTLPSRYSR